HIQSCAHIRHRSADASSSASDDLLAPLITRVEDFAQGVEIAVGGGREHSLAGDERLEATALSAAAYRAGRVYGHVPEFPGIAVQPVVDRAVSDQRPAHPVHQA